MTEKARTLRIGLTGGGSGGHMYPLLAVAREIRRIATGHGVPVDLYYFGRGERYELELKNEMITVIPMPMPKLRRYGSAANIADALAFIPSVVRAWWKLFVLMPDAIFSKGGPGSFPVVLVARFYRIPVVIHESDAQPGLSNLLASRMAAKIAVSFESAEKFFDVRKRVRTGNPIRGELLGGRLATEAAKRELGFSPAAPLVLVVGGSQGARRINEFIALNLTELLAETQILHQTGPANFLEMKKLTQAALRDAAARDLANRYKVVPYLENDLALAYAAADVVVSRAGSGHIFEAAAFGKPMILIPIAESANDHQRANAYEFARGGGGIVIEEPNLLPGIFVSQTKKIIGDPSAADAMSKASRAFAKSGAAEAVANLVIAAASPNQKQGTDGMSDPDEPRAEGSDRD